MEVHHVFDSFQHGWPAKHCAKPEWPSFSISLASDARLLLMLACF
jgi:hypothetical protein